jgi:hypothetical protein
VHFKATGLVLHRLQARTDEARVAFLQEMRSLVDDFQEGGLPIVGYAVVLWDADGGSSASLRAGRGSSIPSIAMPEFVKNRLLAEKIMEWSGR